MLVIWNENHSDSQPVLAKGVKQLCTVGRVGQRFADNFSCEDAALATLAGHAQCVPYFTQRACAVFYSCANLGIGNAFTNANVHLLVATVKFHMSRDES
jgi:hypothetical protein